MFEGLKINTIAVLEPVDNVSFESAMEAAADACMDVFLFSDVDDVENSKIEATIENLLALESAVKNFGLSRALVAFADHDKTLSAAITSIPSLESMSADLSVEDSTAAVEAIKHTIKSIAVGIKYNLVHTFSGYNKAEKRILRWKHLVDGIVEEMDKKTFNVEEAARIECDIVSFAELMALQKSFICAPKILHDLWSTELPTEEDKFEPWLNKIRSEVGILFKAKEAEITDKGKLSIPFSSYLKRKTGEKGSLKAKGYTSDSEVKEVISGFRGLLQAYLNLKALQKTAQDQVKKLTKEGESFDHVVANKAVTVAKNITKALLLDGLWGVSGVSMRAIAKLQKAYTHNGDYEGEAKPNE